MALQRRDDDDDFDSPTTPTQKEVESSSTVNSLAGQPYSMATSSTTDVTSEVTSFEPPNRSRYPKFTFTGRPPWVTDDDSFPPWAAVSTPSTLITTTKPTALLESQYPSKLSTGISLTGAESSPSVSANPHGKERPGFTGPPDKPNHGGMYAAAAITPIVVLGIIAGLVFFCLRKRKRQRHRTAAGQQQIQEMKMQHRPQPSARAYMAPAPGASTQYSGAASQLLSPPNPAVPQPIILGPISSGTNGAYFTGIDTSDVVSMTSASNVRQSTVNPFSDNDSLAEPPPPYRPRSAAPPSLSNSSRHSSFRVAASAPDTSRTQLIERSPFADPTDDDAVSVLSSPIAGRNEDAMSAVSDLSYQHDEVGRRRT